MSVAEDFAAYRKVVGEHIEKLERENAALRNEIRQHEEQIEFLIGENTALQKQLEEWGQSTKWFAEWAEKNRT